MLLRFREVTGAEEGSPFGIKCIVFDWGGTLARSGGRSKFLFSSTRQERLMPIHREAVRALRQLRDRGYILGVISNTRHMPSAMHMALRVTGLHELFDFVVLSSESNMCKKPCQLIFNQAVKHCNFRFHPSQFLYVGDNYQNDVIGALQAGMKVALITRGPNAFYDFFHNYLQGNLSEPPHYLITKINDLLSLKYI